MDVPPWSPGSLELTWVQEEPRLVRGAHCFLPYRVLETFNTHTWNTRGPLPVSAAPAPSPPSGQILASYDLIHSHCISEQLFCML